MSRKTHPRRPPLCLIPLAALPLHLAWKGLADKYDDTFQTLSKFFLTDLFSLSFFLAEVEVDDVNLI